MSDKPDRTGTWEGDVNEAAIDEWKAETTAFDRVTTVIDTTAEPAFAREIAEHAAVAEPTARRHLQSLAEAGRVTAVSAEGGIKYRRSPSTLAMRRIATLHDEYSKTELQEAIEDLREKLATLRRKHGVGDADDLVTELEAGADGWTDVSRMRTLEENLDVAKAALHLYDFDPDDSGRASTTTNENAADTSRGSLAGFDGPSVA
jgi:DNA-binding transcriptional ArsR family regulator